MELYLQCNRLYQSSHAWVHINSSCTLENMFLPPTCSILSKATMKLSSTTSILTLIAGAVSQATSFNITAISAANNAARLECWQLAAPPVLGRGAVNFDLGDFDGAFVGIIPPNTTTGTINNAAKVQSVEISHRQSTPQLTPYHRYSLIMSGLAHISTPNSGLPAHLNEAWITGGPHGMLIAADLKEIAAKGHVTEFPSQERTLIAQFPVAGNKAPAHKILHVGPCTLTDLAGL